MNSYPHEVSSNQDPSPPELMKQFLSHPRPLMFVAGLTPSRDRSASTASGSGQRSRAGSTVARLEATHGGPALTTPIASPNPVAHASLPISPPATSPPIRNDDSSKSLDQIAGPSTSSAGLLPAGEDEFELLIRNMREALEGLGGKGKVWVNQKERRDFRILLVDKVKYTLGLVEESADRSSMSVYLCGKLTLVQLDHKETSQLLIHHYHLLHLPLLLILTV